MLTVVLFLWHTQQTPHRFESKHVNTMQRMLAMHLKVPHRIVLVTDNGHGVDSRIKCIPIDAALTATSRFAKLMLFRPDAAELFGGSRLLFLDLDLVLLGDMTALVQRAEDFIIWRDPLATREGYRQTHCYNSSVMLMNAGARPQLWTQFDLSRSPETVRRSRLVGSDQAWIGMVLGPNAAVFTQTDGVYGYKHDLNKGRDLPSNAVLVSCHGRPKPWELEDDHPLRIGYQQAEAA